MGLPRRVFQEASMKKSDRPQLNRRHVFAGAGTVGALAAAATLLPQVKQEAVPTAAKEPAQSGEGRYQVTQHVLRYYETAKV
jgi:hypothetical protein